MTYQYKFASPSRPVQMKYAELPVFRYQTFDQSPVSFTGQPVIPQERIIFSDRHGDTRSMPNSMPPSRAASVRSSSPTPSNIMSEPPFEHPPLLDLDDILNQGPGERGLDSDVDHEQAEVVQHEPVIEEAPELMAVQSHTSSEPKPSKVKADSKAKKTVKKSSSKKKKSSGSSPKHATAVPVKKSKSKDQPPVQVPAREPEPETVDVIPVREAHSDEVVTEPEVNLEQAAMVESTQSMVDEVPPTPIHDHSEDHPAEPATEGLVEEGNQVESLPETPVVVEDLPTTEQIAEVKPEPEEKVETLEPEELAHKEADAKEGVSEIEAHGPALDDTRGQESMSEALAEPEATNTEETSIETTEPQPIEIEHPLMELPAAHEIIGEVDTETKDPETQVDETPEAGALHLEVPPMSERVNLEADTSDAANPVSQPAEAEEPLSQDLELERSVTSKEGIAENVEKAPVAVSEHNAVEAAVAETASTEDESNQSPSDIKGEAVEDKATDIAVANEQPPPEQDATTNEVVTPVEKADIEEAPSEGDGPAAHDTPVVPEHLATTDIESEEQPAATTEIPAESQKIETGPIASSSQEEETVTPHITESMEGTPAKQDDFEALIEAKVPEEGLTDRDQAIAEAVNESTTEEVAVAEETATEESKPDEVTGTVEAAVEETKSDKEAETEEEPLSNASTAGITAVEGSIENHAGEEATIKPDDIDEVLTETASAIEVPTEVHTTAEPPPIDAPTEEKVVEQVESKELPADNAHTEEPLSEETAADDASPVEVHVEEAPAQQVTETEKPGESPAETNTVDSAISDVEPTNEASADAAPEGHVPSEETVNSEEPIEVELNNEALPGSDVVQEVPVEQDATPSTAAEPEEPAAMGEKGLTPEEKAAAMTASITAAAAAVAEKKRRKHRHREISPEHLNTQKGHLLRHRGEGGPLKNAFSQSIDTAKREREIRHATPEYQEKVRRRRERREKEEEAEREERRKARELRRKEEDERQQFRQEVNRLADAERDRLRKEDEKKMVEKQRNEAEMKEKKLKEEASRMAHETVRKERRHRRNSAGSDAGSAQGSNPGSANGRPRLPLAGGESYVGGGPLLLINMRKAGGYDPEPKRDLQSPRKLHRQDTDPSPTSPIHSEAGHRHHHRHHSSSKTKSTDDNVLPITKVVRRLGIFS